MTEKVERKIHRIKVSEFELRVAINALNEQRLKMKERGEDTTDLNDLILKLLDILENK